MATADKIMLGIGTVTVGATAIGLTRGGSVFMVEREIREIEADGDFGPVEGRVVIDREVAKLTVNALELFTAANMTKYYPASEVVADPLVTPTGDIFTGTLEIVAGDYNDVVWTGKTKDGKAVVITLENAMNVSGVEWTLEDKSEVVPSLEFVAHYSEATRETPPWKVRFAR